MLNERKLIGNYKVGNNTFELYNLKGLDVVEAHLWQPNQHKGIFGLLEEIQYKERETDDALGKEKINEIIENYKKGLSRNSPEYTEFSLYNIIKTINNQNSNQFKYDLAVGPLSKVSARTSHFVDHDILFENKIKNVYFLERDSSNNFMKVKNAMQEIQNGLKRINVSKIKNFKEEEFEKAFLDEEKIKHYSKYLTGQSVENENFNYNEFKEYSRVVNKYKDYVEKTNEYDINNFFNVINENKLKRNYKTIVMSPTSDGKMSFYTANVKYKYLNETKDKRVIEIGESLGTDFSLDMSDKVGFGRPGVIDYTSGITKTASSSPAFSMLKHYMGMIEQQNSNNPNRFENSIKLKDRANMVYTKTKTNLQETSFANLYSSFQFSDLSRDVTQNSYRNRYGTYNLTYNRFVDMFYDGNENHSSLINLKKDLAKYITENNGSSVFTYDELEKTFKNTSFAINIEFDKIREKVNDSSAYNLTMYNPAFSNNSKDDINPVISFKTKNFFKKEDFFKNRMLDRKITDQTINLKSRENYIERTGLLNVKIGRDSSPYASKWLNQMITLNGETKTRWEHMNTQPNSIKVIDTAGFYNQQMVLQTGLNNQDSDISYSTILNDLYKKYYGSSQIKKNELSMSTKELIDNWKYDLQFSFIKQYSLETFTGEKFNPYSSETPTQYLQKIIENKRDTLSSDYIKRIEGVLQNTNENNLLAQVASGEKIYAVSYVNKQGQNASGKVAFLEPFSHPLAFLDDLNQRRTQSVDIFGAFQTRRDTMSLNKQLGKALSIIPGFEYQGQSINFLEQKEFVDKINDNYKEKIGITKDIKFNGLTNVNDQNSTLAKVLVANTDFSWQDSNFMFETTQLRFNMSPDLMQVREINFNKIKYDKIEKFGAQNEFYSNSEELMNDIKRIYNNSKEDFFVEGTQGYHLMSQIIGKKDYQKIAYAHQHNFEEQLIPANESVREIMSRNDIGLREKKVLATNSVLNFRNEIIEKNFINGKKGKSYFGSNETLNDELIINKSNHIYIDDFNINSKGNIELPIQKLIVGGSGAKTHVGSAKATQSGFNSLTGYVDFEFVGKRLQTDIGVISNNKAGKVKRGFGGLHVNGVLSTMAINAINSPLQNEDSSLDIISLRKARLQSLIDNVFEKDILTVQNAQGTGLNKTSLSKLFGLTYSINNNGELDVSSKFFKKGFSQFFQQQLASGDLNVSSERYIVTEFYNNARKLGFHIDPESGTMMTTAILSETLKAHEDYIQNYINPNYIADNVVAFRNKNANVKSAVLKSDSKVDYNTLTNLKDDYFSFLFIQQINGMNESITQKEEEALKVGSTFLNVASKQRLKYYNEYLNVLIKESTEKQEEIYKTVGTVKALNEYKRIDDEVFNIGQSYVIDGKKLSEHSNFLTNDTSADNFFDTNNNFLVSDALKLEKNKTQPLAIMFSDIEFNYNGRTISIGGYNSIEANKTYNKMQQMIASNLSLDGNILSNISDGDLRIIQNNISNNFYGDNNQDKIMSDVFDNIKRSIIKNHQVLSSELNTEEGKWHAYITDKVNKYNFESFKKSNSYEDFKSLIYARMSILDSIHEKHKNNFNYSDTSEALLKEIYGEENYSRIVKPYLNGQKLNDINKGANGSQTLLYLMKGLNLQDNGELVYNKEILDVGRLAKLSQEKNKARETLLKVEKIEEAIVNANETQALETVGKNVARNKKVEMPTLENIKKNDKFLEVWKNNVAKTKTFHKEINKNKDFKSGEVFDILFESRKKEFLLNMTDDKFDNSDYLFSSLGKNSNDFISRKFNVIKGATEEQVKNLETIDGKKNITEKVYSMFIHTGNKKSNNAFGVISILDKNIELNKRDYALVDNLKEVKRIIEEEYINGEFKESLKYAISNVEKIKEGSSEYKNIKNYIGNKESVFNAFYQDMYNAQRIDVLKTQLENTIKEFNSNFNIDKVSKNTEEIINDLTKNSNKVLDGRFEKSISISPSEGSGLNTRLINYFFLNEEEGESLFFKKGQLKSVDEIESSFKKTRRITDKLYGDFLNQRKFKENYESVLNKIKNGASVDEIEILLKNSNYKNELTEELNKIMGTVVLEKDDFENLFGIGSMKKNPVRYGTSVRPPTFYLTSVLQSRFVGIDENDINDSYLSALWGKGKFNEASDRTTSYMLNKATMLALMGDFDGDKTYAAALSMKDLIKKMPYKKAQFLLEKAEKDIEFLNVLTTNIYMGNDILDFINNYTYGNKKTSNLSLQKIFDSSIAGEIGNLDVNKDADKIRQIILDKHEAQIYSSRNALGLVSGKVKSELEDADDVVKLGSKYDFEIITNSGKKIDVKHRGSFWEKLYLLTPNEKKLKLKDMSNDDVKKMVSTILNSEFKNHFNDEEVEILQTLYREPEHWSKSFNSFKDKHGSLILKYSSFSDINSFKAYVDNVKTGAVTDTLTEFSSFHAFVIQNENIFKQYIEEGIKNGYQISDTNRQNLRKISTAFGILGDHDISDIGPEQAISSKKAVGGNAEDLNRYFSKIKKAFFDKNDKIYFTKNFDNILEASNEYKKILQAKTDKDLKNITFINFWKKFFIDENDAEEVLIKNNLAKNILFKGMQLLGVDDIEVKQQTLGNLDLNKASAYEVAELFGLKVENGVLNEESFAKFNKIIGHLNQVFEAKFSDDLVGYSELSSKPDFENVTRAFKNTKEFFSRKINGVFGLYNKKENPEKIDLLDTLEKENKKLKQENEELKKATVNKSQNLTKTEAEIEKETEPVAQNISETLKKEATNLSKNEEIVNNSIKNELKEIEDDLSQYEISINEKDLKNSVDFIEKPNVTTSTTKEKLDFEVDKHEKQDKLFESVPENTINSTEEAISDEVKLSKIIEANDTLNEIEKENNKIEISTSNTADILAEESSQETEKINELRSKNIEEKTVNKSKATTQKFYEKIETVTEKEVNKTEETISEIATEAKNIKEETTESIAENMNDASWKQASNVAEEIKEIAEETINDSTIKESKKVTETMSDSAEKIMKGAEEISDGLKKAVKGKEFFGKKGVAIGIGAGVLAGFFNLINRNRTVVHLEMNDQINQNQVGLNSRNNLQRRMGQYYIQTNIRDTF